MNEQRELNNAAIDALLTNVNNLSKQSIDHMLELEAIFKAIKSLAGEHEGVSRLASAGEYLAGDKANVFDCWREEIITDAKKELSA